MILKLFRVVNAGFVRVFWMEQNWSLFEDCLILQFTIVPLSNVSVCNVIWTDKKLAWYLYYGLVGVYQIFDRIKPSYSRRNMSSTFTIEQSSIVTNPVIKPL